MSTEQQPRAPARSFRDASGVPWTVHEVDATRSQLHQGARCLIFESPHAGRRVWRFPADWSDLADDELENLSWGR